MKKRVRIVNRSGEASRVVVRGGDAPRILPVGDLDLGELVDSRAIGKWTIRLVRGVVWSIVIGRSERPTIVLGYRESRKAEALEHFAELDERQIDEMIAKKAHLS